MMEKNKICFTYRSEKTWNGVRFDVAKSALQKYIRRGNVEKACMIACELDLFRQFSEGKRLWTNVYNRVRVILLEDVGIHSPHMFIKANDLLGTWKRCDRVMSMALVELITLMTCNYHSRYLSHVRKFFLTHDTKLRGKVDHERLKLYTDNKIESETEMMKMYIEQCIYCLDKRSVLIYYWINKIIDHETMNEKYNRSKKTGNALFFILDRYFRLNKINETVNTVYTVFTILRDWYKTLKVKENFLCIAFPIYTYIYQNDLYWGKDFLMKPVNSLYYERVLKKESIVLDSFTVDKHCLRGKTRGADSYDFAVEGSMVAYEWKHFTHSAKLKRNYEAWHKKRGNVKHEKDVFHWDVRAQLVTGRNKQDTYFAHDRLGKSVVVKGPYEKKRVECIYNIYSVLYLFEKINRVEFSIKEMTVESGYKYKGPLGIRNQWDFSTPGFFLISENLFPEHLPVKEKSSKLWKPTLVVDYDSLDTDEYGFGIPSTLENDTLLEFIYHYAIKYIFMIPDNAYRNFIVKKGKVYLIDCEEVFVSNHCKFSVKEKKAMKDGIEKNRDAIESVLHSWKTNRTRLNMVKNILECNDEQIECLIKRCDTFLEETWE